MLPEGRENGRFPPRETKFFAGNSVLRLFRAASGSIVSAGEPDYSPEKEMESETEPGIGGGVCHVIENTSGNQPELQVVQALPLHY